MDAGFNTWDCSWYWDNNFGDLSLIDSAFYELETEPLTNGNIAHGDQFRLLHAVAEDDLSQRRCTENLPNICRHYGDCCRSTTNIDLQSDFTESYGSDSGPGSSLSIEELETSDTESVVRSTECDSVSSVIEHSSSCCLDDIFSTSASESCRNDEVTDDSLLSRVGCCRNLPVTSSSVSSADVTDSEYQLAQHRPLVFFVIGLFVGLSLGFLTCIVTVSAALHRMHMEIVGGRTLYAECQRKSELLHRSVLSSETPQVNIDVVVGSIWQEKFEEMVVENAELQLKFSSLQTQMSCVLDKMQQSVTKLNLEVTALKQCIDDDVSNLAGDIHSVFVNKNNSNMNTIS